MPSAIKRHLSVCLAAVVLSACASTAALRQGEQAELAQDFDRAVIEYTRALQENPNDTGARQGLERTRLRAAQNHFTRARRHYAAGRLDEALVELELASELNPTDPNVEELLDTVRTQQQTKVAIERDGKTELESLIERSRTLEAPGTELPDVRLPAALTFRDARARDVYTALARFAEVNLVFDPQFRDQPVTIDLRNATLKDALDSLSNATRNFYRVTGQRTITVIPDTPAKRTEYEEEIVRTFYLSNADVKETLDLLRIVIDNRRLAPITATNALSIKDTPERVSAAGRLIAAIDKARPEVVIDVELLEVDRTLLREWGLQIASPGSPQPPGISGSADVNREGLTLENLQNLTASDVFMTNVPALFYRLMKSDANTRILANPQLRTSEGMTASARFGERVPVPVTTFAPIATGGVAQQPITSFNYENIGVNIDITPRTHHDADVSLALKVLVSNISGTGFGGLPTFGNRELSTVIRLRDGETNLLAGLIRDTEREVVEGVPGLIDIPFVGRLFARNRRETQATDIVLTLTPRIVRILELTEEDLRPFRVGRGAGTAGPGLFPDVPFELQVPGAAPPQGGQAQPPAPEGVPGPAAPIQPPAPQQPPPAPPPDR
jgi:general secretion pathway protein D